MEGNRNIVFRDNTVDICVDSGNKDIVFVVRGRLLFVTLLVNAFIKEICDYPANHYTY